MAEFDAGTIEATLTLDRDPFQRGLAMARADAAEFEGKRITATADVDTGKAKERLAALRADLGRLEHERATAGVSVDGVARAMAELTVLERQLEHIDHMNVSPRVKAGAFSMLAREVGDAERMVSRLAMGAEAATPALSSAGQGASFMGTNLKILGPALAVVIPAVIALAAAAAAMVSSLAFATAGLGALAVAGFGAMLPVAGLAVVAMKLFGNESGIAGTKAHALAQAASGLGRSLMTTLAPAARHVFQGITDGIKAIQPVISSLRGPFLALGKALETAFAGAGKSLAGMAPQFRALITAAAPLMGPLVSAATSLLSIFTQIATAAMPFLVSGVRSVAQAFAGWAKGLSDSKSLSSTIATLVGHLKSWLSLGAAVGRVFLAFFKGTAPLGKSLVDSLTRGANALAKWLSSARGQKQIQDFFQKMVPLAGQVARLLIQMIPLFARLATAAAPALTRIFSAMNTVIGAINKLTPLWKLLGASIQAATIIMFPLVSIVKLIGAAIDALGLSVSKAWSNLKSATTDTWNAITTAITAAWNAIKAAATAGAAAVVGAVTGAWNNLKSATSDTWNAIKSVVVGAWNAIKSAASAAVNAVVAVVTGGWARVKGATTSAWAAIKGAVSAGAAAVLGAVKGMVSSIVGAFAGLAGQLFAMGKNIILSLARGIKAAAGAAISAAKSVASSVAGAVGGALGIGSPSRLTTQYGRWVMEGLARGIMAGGDQAQRAIATSVKRVRELIREVTPDAQEARERVRRHYNQLIAEVKKGHEGVKRTLREAMRRALAAVTEGAGQRRTVLQRMLGDLSDLAKYEKAVDKIGDALAEMAEKAGAAYTAQLVRPLQGQLDQMKAEDAAAERADQRNDLNRELSEAIAMQGRRGIDESEADYYARVAEGRKREADARAGLTRMGREDVEAGLASQIEWIQANPAITGADAYAQGLSSQFAGWAQQLASGTLSYGGLMTQVSQALAPVGMTAEGLPGITVTPPRTLLSGGARNFGPSQGTTSVIQQFNIPPAPAAHGLPDPRAVAVQLASLLRSMGGVP